MQNITLRFGQKGDARRKIDIHRRGIHEIGTDDYYQKILLTSKTIIIYRFFLCFIMF